MKKVKITGYLPFLILFIGAVARLAFLGSVPHGMHQDESFVAWNAFAIFHEQMDSAGHIFPVYMADWGDGHSALYVWLTLPLLAMNSGHINAFIARLPQAIVGICTLLAVYGIVKRTVNEKLALISMFLLAICPWHIMMCRWGLDANLAPGFLMFGLYFFIRGLSDKRFFLLSALFYGLTLYAYAVIWPIVPFLLLLQILYAFCHKKVNFNRYTIGSAVLLFIMALPLLTFILVNSGVIAEVKLPFLTIPVMGGYRGDEVAFDLHRMWSNFRTTLSLLWHQNTGAPYDILLPWGLFFDIGRIFIFVGAIALTVHSLRTLISKKYDTSVFIFIQLLGGGLCSILVTAVLHQINALYIPLILCEGYGVYWLLNLFAKWHKKMHAATGIVITAIYLFCFAGFEYDYYTDYKELADAYFGAGLKECVNFATETCKENGLSTITVEKGAQWPRLLLYTETKPSEYLESVVYDVPPAPASFVSDSILIRTRMDKEHINVNSVYILYFPDKDLFTENFELTQFYDWYVAVPK